VPRLPVGAAQRAAAPRRASLLDVPAECRLCEARSER